MNMNDIKEYTCLFEVKDFYTTINIDGNTYEYIANGYRGYLLDVEKLNDYFYNEGYTPTQQVSYINKKIKHIEQMFDRSKELSTIMFLDQTWTTALDKHIALLISDYKAVLQALEATFSTLKKIVEGKQTTLFT